MAWLAFIGIVGCTEDGSTEMTLADPPSRGYADPHSPNSFHGQPAAQRLEAAKRLHESGLQSGSLWDLKECIAFFPEYAPCHRDLGIIVYRTNPRGSAFLREAVNGLREYLRLEPETPDRGELLEKINELESVEFEKKRRERRWAGRFPIPDKSDRMRFEEKPVRNANAIEKLAALFEPLDDIELDAVRRAISGSQELRRAGNDHGAVEHIEEFLKSAPESVANSAKDQARIWCELGLANVRVSPAKAEEAFRVGVEQYRYDPANHYCLCVLLPSGAEKRDFCKIYVTLAGKNGRHVVDAEAIMQGEAE